ncbi:MAG: S9 family peptidase [Burkholderiaceae bacterium]
MSATPYTVEDHIKLARVSQIAAAPDGSWLAVSVQRLDADGVKYASDLWRVPTDGSAAVQLTRGDSKDHSPCFRADGALGFLSNRAPNEIKADEDADQRSQIWLLPAAGGEPRQLTDEPLGVQAFKFAAQSERMVWLAPVLLDVAHDKQRETAAERKKKGSSVRRYTEQPVRHWDHWLHENADFAFTHLIAANAEGGERIALTPAARREFAIDPGFDIAADGSRVVITTASLGPDRELDTALLLIDLAHRSTQVIGAAPRGHVEAPRFAPDGKSVVAVVSRRDAKVAIAPRAVVFDLASGAARTLAAESELWPQPGDFSADGKTLYATADDNGHVPVFAIDLASGAVGVLADTAGGGAHSDLVALPDGRVACIRSTLLDAPECHVISPEHGTRALARLSGFTPASDWAVIERIDVPSTDGVTIQTWITRPKHASGPRPALLWIHGGPIGMSADGWHWRWNALLAAAQGYMVVQPNPRGSTGFGQAFVQGIWGNVWGDQCYADLMAVTDAVAARSDVDPTRMMAMGGSFGGYMTNWIGTQTKRFRCLITHASIVTLAQFTGTTDHPGWWYLEMGGENPYADRESFDRHAPIAHITAWKTPALIIHGELDYRCPIGEGLNLFEALRYQGVPAELMIFPDENHWILKPRNTVAWYEGVFDYLKRHLT